MTFSSDQRPYYVKAHSMKWACLHNSRKLYSVSLHIINNDLDQMKISDMFNYSQRDFYELTFFSPQLQ